MIFIYAIRFAGSVLYVGQSTNPKARIRAILWKRGINSLAEREHYTLELLQKVSSSSALDVESRTIKRFWKAGQCGWNKAARKGAVGHRAGKPVVELTSGIEFDSVGAASRHYGCTYSTIRNWIKNGSPGEEILKWGTRHTCPNWPTYFQGANI